jgi:hypothetical protein
MSLNSFTCHISGFTSSWVDAPTCRSVVVDSTELLGRALAEIPK